MNPTVTPLLPDSPQQLWVKFVPDQEMADLCEMPNDHRGLFITLRTYSLRHNGFTSDIEELWKAAKYFSGMSRYKFFKIIPDVLQKFSNFEGRFFYGPDQQRLSESQAKIQKYREYGKLGAQSKWAGSPKVTEMPQPDEMAKPSDPGNGLGGCLSHTNHSADVAALSSCLSEGESREGDSEQNAVQTGFPRSQALIASRFPDVNAKFMNQLGDACRQVEPTVTDELLCAGISEVYREGQKSAGLFLKTVPAWIVNRKQGKIFTGKLEANRKPTASEIAMENVLRRNGAIP